MEMLASLVLSVFYLFYLQDSASGSATISSNGKVPVCSGDQLELTCNVIGDQVEWSIVGIPENETIAVRYGRRFLNDLTETESELTVNSILFIFSRISPRNELPLVTRLITSPISNGINGTEVVCRDSVSRNSSSTTVIVISKTSVPDNQTRNCHSLILGDDDGVSVVAILQWKDINLQYHNITIIPDTHFIARHDTVTMKMLYRTLYNVSIIHMCSGPNSIPLCIGLYYSIANCSGDALDVSSVSVINCKNSQVQYTIDNNDTRCSDVATQMDHTTVSVFQMDADNGNSGSLSQTVPFVIVSIAVCVLSSLFFFTLGFLCRHHCQKKYPVMDPQNSQHQETQRHNILQSEQIEVKENEAYSSLNLR